VNIRLEEGDKEVKGDKEDKDKCFFSSAQTADSAMLKM
jgi:hypothetical protein